MEHPGLTSHEKWILQGVTFAFLIYCLFRMVIPMTRSLKSKEDIIKLFTTQPIFIALTVSCLISGILFFLKGYYSFSKHFDLMAHALYACFEMAVSWSRMPRNLFDDRPRLFTKTMFIVGETLVGSSILLRFLATAIYGVPWVHAVAKWWSVISSISFVASEMNCFIQTRRMLKEMPSDFEDFDKTKRVLGYLIEANAAASVAGIYSLFYIIYGYFTLDCFAIFGGSIAFKAYASVFAITFARSSRTITATHNTGKESSSVASAHGNKYLAVSAETGSIESSV